MERGLVRLFLVGLLLVMVGCAMTPVYLEQGAGPVTWRGTAFQVTSMAVHGDPGEHYTFTLLLHECMGTAITFTRIAPAVCAHQTAVAYACKFGVLQMQAATMARPLGALRHEGSGSAGSARWPVRQRQRQWCRHRRG
jgi:hypothetical protein